MSNIDDQIQQERENAKNVCSADGTDSGNCAAAWDAVEELQAEASHQRQKQTPKSNFEQYCDDNPDAVECRVYDD